MKYWVIIADWEGNPSYGVDSASHLIGIYTSEEEAKEALNSELVKTKLETILKYHSDEFYLNFSLPACFSPSVMRYGNESFDTRIIEFDPEKTDTETLTIDYCVGGGWYVE